MPHERKPPTGQRRAPPGRPRQKPAASTSWDPLAAWYDGWVGEGGSEHHRLVAVPAVVKLLDARAGEEILDIGAGQGVLISSIAHAGARYTGVDASPRLVAIGRERHSQARLYVGDARKLSVLPEIRERRFDAAVFLLSLQDMDPLESVLESVAGLLKPHGRVVLLLTHPAFRVPRQSGWGWDDGRKLVYRRIDRYVTPLPVPMKALPGKDAQTTRSFHRPVSAYINALAACGLLTDRMEEIPGHKLNLGTATPKAAETARLEIPLFLGIRARKTERPPA